MTFRKCPVCDAPISTKWLLSGSDTLYTCPRCGNRLTMNRSVKTLIMTALVFVAVNRIVPKSDWYFDVVYLFVVVFGLSLIQLLCTKIVSVDGTDITKRLP